MPISSRLDVSCPQFLLACCLLIQFQLKPRKSTTIFFPTVSFRVCCRYTLEMHEKRDVYATLLHSLRPEASVILLLMCLQGFKLLQRVLLLQRTPPLHHEEQYDSSGTIWHWRMCTAKSKEIRAAVSVSESNSEFTLVSNQCVCVYVCACVCLCVCASSLSVNA